MTRPLPHLTDLARVRRRANEGRYQVAVLPDGTFDPLPPGLVDYQPGSDDDPARFYPPGTRIVNAANVRDAALDCLEHLADCENIAALLTRRLQADDLLTRALQADLGNLRQTLVSADHYLRRIREQLLPEYCRDQLPVQRDEV